MPTAHRFTVDEYHRLTDFPSFTNRQVELIHGEIFDMSPKGSAHSAFNMLLLRLLIPMIGERAFVRSQEPITIPPDSEPEPDLVIAKLRDDEYRTSHPQPKEVLLLMEVSDSTLSYDRSIKLSLYATAGIEHYWIFNLVDSRLERYSQPYSSQGKGDYLARQLSLPHEVVPLSQFPDLTLNLARLFNTHLF